MNALKSLFKKKTLDSQIREWNKSIAKECRKITRKIQYDITPEVKKMKQSLKEAAKRGDAASCRIYARSIVQTNRDISRMYTARSRLESISRTLNQQLAQIKAVQYFKDCTEITAKVSAACRLPEIREIMQKMSQEMTKAGLITELVDEAIDDIIVDSDEEDQAIDQVMKEVLSGIKEKLEIIQSTRQPSNDKTTLISPVREILAQLEQA